MEPFYLFVSLSDVLQLFERYIPLYQFIEDPSPQNSGVERITCEKFFWFYLEFN